jgi:hypothetical protein
MAPLSSLNWESPRGPSPSCKSTTLLRRVLTLLRRVLTLLRRVLTVLRRVSIHPSIAMLMYPRSLPAQLSLCADQFQFQVVPISNRPLKPLTPLIGSRRGVCGKSDLVVGLPLGFGTTEYALDRWTNPKLSRRTCTCEYGLQSWRGKSAGVVKRPRERSPEIPTVRFAALHIAVLRG